MKTRNQLRSGVLLSYLNLAISSIIPFVYTPIMLDILGQAEYGLYALSNSVVGYLSLLNFGFGTTIVRYLSKYRAEGNTEGVRTTFGFFLVLYSILGAVIMAGGMILSANTASIFDKGLVPSEIEIVRTLIVLMAFNMAVSFPLSVFSSVFLSHERFNFQVGMNVLSTIAAPIANLIALFLGYGAIGMTLAATVTQFLLAPVSLFYSFRVLKVTPKFSWLPKTLVREMIGFSAFVFIGSLVDMLFWATDKVILGMLASSVAVAIYNVGVTFNTIVSSLSGTISGVMVPRITGMVAQNTDKTQWSELFIKVGRLQFLIIALIVSGFAVFGQSFIQLWAGADYAEAYWVTVLTMFPLLVPLIQNTGISFLTAQNKHQFRSIVYLIIAIANVISTYLIVPYMGIIGAALCSCVAYLLGQGLIMNIYYYKVTGLDIPLFWKNILKMAVVPALMLAAGLVINRVIVMDNWFIFFGGVVLFTGVYAVLMYCFAMDDYEKDIIRKPLKKAARVLRKG